VGRARVGARAQPEPGRGHRAGARRHHGDYHRVSEELYLVSAGRGRLIVEGEERLIAQGDCALIPPGARHKVFNVGDEPLRIVCACAPAYSHEDTFLTE
jgi:mannose-6-phosphate isomerase-like protein (cupin superfamily)